MAGERGGVLTVDVTLESVKVEGRDVEGSEALSRALAEGIGWGLDRLRERITDNAPEDSSGFEPGDYPRSHVFESPILSELDSRVVRASADEVTGFLQIPSPHAADVEFGTLALGEHGGERFIEPRNARALLIPLELIRNHVGGFVPDEKDLARRTVTIGSKAYIFSAHAFIPGQYAQHYVKKSIGEMRGQFTNHMKSVLSRALSSTYKGTKVAMTLDVSVA